MTLQFGRAFRGIRLETLLQGCDRVAHLVESNGAELFVERHPLPKTAFQDETDDLIANRQVATPCLPQQRNLSCGCRRTRQGAAIRQTLVDLGLGGARLFRVGELPIGVGRVKRVQHGPTCLLNVELEIVDEVETISEAAIEHGGVFGGLAEMSCDDDTHAQHDRSDEREHDPLPMSDLDLDSHRSVVPSDSVAATQRIRGFGGQ